MARNKFMVIGSMGIITILLILIITSGCVDLTKNTDELEPVSAEYIDSMYTALYPSIYIISDKMTGADSSVWNTARDLDGVPFDDPSVELALFKLKRDIPVSFEAGLFDINETLIASTDEIGKCMENGFSKATYHYTEEDFKAAGSQCIVSGWSTLCTGEQGVTISTAVYDAEGQYNGTLRVGIDTWFLFSGINEYLRNTYGLTFWVIQDDGLVIYDKDVNEVDRYMLTDDLYQIPSLQTAVKTIIKEPSGNTSYLFYDSTWVDLIQVNTAWDTVYPGYGMEWRVVLSDNQPMKIVQESTTTPSAEELKAFVEKAYVYTQRVDKENALTAFNDPNGEFIDGELYIFAYGMDGEILALPYQPGLIGENRWFYEDPNGVRIIQRMIARAQQGGGYVRYLYPNPAHNYAEEYKLSYVMMVDDSWLIGAGVYLQDNPLSQTEYIDLAEHELLTYQVRDLQYLAKAKGISQVVEKIKDPESGLQIDGLYPFAVTENGTTLAETLNPEMAGTNQLGMKNSFGMSIARDVISLAQAGGGVMYSLVEIPDLHEERDVLIYVEPVDAATYVGSMMILG